MQSISKGEARGSSKETRARKAGAAEAIVARGLTRKGERSHCYYAALPNSIQKEASRAYKVYSRARISLLWQKLGTVDRYALFFNNRHLLLSKCLERLHSFVGSL